MFNNCKSNLNANLGIWGPKDWSISSFDEADSFKDQFTLDLNHLGQCIVAISLI